MRRSRLALWAIAGAPRRPGPARRAPPAAAVFKIPRRDIPPIESLSDIMPSASATRAGAPAIKSRSAAHEKAHSRGGTDAEKASLAGPQKVLLELLTGHGDEFFRGQGQLAGGQGDDVEGARVEDRIRDLHRGQQTGLDRLHAGQPWQERNSLPGAREAVLQIDRVRLKSWLDRDAGRRRGGLDELPNTVPPQAEPDRPPGKARQ